MNSPPSESPDTLDYSAVFDSNMGMDDQFLDFWTGPFSMMPSPSFSTDMQLDLFDPSVLPTTARRDSTSSESAQISQDPAQYVSAMNLAIYNKLWCLAVEPQVRQELTNLSNFLLTSEKITKYISLYFRNWHLNCPILHRPSFDPNEVPLGLLLSVVFIGAMYSKDQSERFAAKKLIDVAELVVFDANIFSLDMEITQALQHGSITSSDNVEDDWSLFQDLQAGYLMIVAQYWGGARIAKWRAIESRYGDVIKVSTSLVNIAYTNIHPQGVSKD
jgi:hypothetical protein